MGGGSVRRFRRSIERPFEDVGRAVGGAIMGGRGEEFAAPFQTAAARAADTKRLEDISKGTAETKRLTEKYDADVIKQFGGGATFSSLRGIESKAEQSLLKQDTEWARKLRAKKFAVGKQSLLTGGELGIDK